MRVRRSMLAALAATAATAAAVVVPTGAAGAATFGTPVVVSGQDTGEPGIDVAPDGTLYVNAPAALLSNLPGSPSFVFRSTDGGASWTQTPAGQRANLPGGGDSDVAVDQNDGTVYMSDLWLGSSTVAVSHDRGNTWTANPLGGVPVQDRQWTATAGGGRAYLTYNQLPSGLIVSKSVDGGVTYLPAGIAATPVDRTGCICPPGNIIAEGTSASTDKVGVIFADSSGGVGFAKSTNGASTFTRTTISTTNGADTSTNFPVVANAGGNKLVAVWQEVVNNTTRVRMSTSTNWGTSWSAAKTIVSGGTSVYPWVDAKGGKVAVSLYHTDGAVATPDTAPEGVQWFEQYLESTDGGATFSAPATVDPTVVKTGPICTGGTDCSEDRELLDFQQVAIDGAGHADLTWTRSIDGQENTEILFVHETS